MKKATLRRPRLLVTAPLDFLPALKRRIQRETRLTYAYRARRRQVERLLVRGRYDAWMTAPCPTYYIDKALIDLCPTLKIISTPSTGSNHIDVDYARSISIEVFALKGTRAVDRIYASSEFTFELMAATIRRTPYAFDAVRRGRWRDVERLYRGRELNGLTLGIVGCGRIGGNLVRYASAFGMRVLAYDPYVAAVPSGARRLASLDRLLPAADVVAVCVHLNPETTRMAGDSFFRKMKRGAYFINTSRGDVVDEKALLAHLRSGRLKAAGLDVISGELTGSKDAHPLIRYCRSHDNLLITPHIAGLTYDSESKAQSAAYEAVLRTVSGG